MKSTSFFRAQGDILKLLLLCVNFSPIVNNTKLLIYCQKKNVPNPDFDPDEAGAKKKTFNNFAQNRT